MNSIQFKLPIATFQIRLDLQGDTQLGLFSEGNFKRTKILLQKDWTNKRSINGRILKKFTILSFFHFYSLLLVSSNTFW